MAPGTDPVQISDWHRRHGRANNENRNIERAAEVLAESLPERKSVTKAPAVDVDDPIGPAFDANTLSTPTPRKLVGCWMDQAGLRTLIVPQVWDELTHQPPSLRRQGPITSSA